MKHYAALALCLFLFSCAERGSNPPGCAPASGWHVGSILNSSGAYLMLAGVGALAIGLLAFGASFLTEFIPQRIRAACIFVAELGAGCIAIGSALVWLGNHPWLLAVAIAAVAVAFALRYHRLIARWLGLRTPPQPNLRKAVVLASSQPVEVTTTIPKA